MESTLKTNPSRFLSPDGPGRSGRRVRVVLQDDHLLWDNFNLLLCHQHLQDCGQLQGDECKDTTLDISGSDLKAYTSEVLPPCHSDWVNPHSIANYGLRKDDLVERALMVAFLALFWLAMGFMYRKIMDICRDIDEANDTPCDWTLMITHLPPGQDEASIREHFLKDAKLAKLKNLEINKISIAYNLDEYIKLSDKITSQRNLIKKIQAKESSKQSMTSLPELQELKSKSIPQSNEHLNGAQSCSLS